MNQNFPPPRWNLDAQNYVTDFTDFRSIALVDEKSLVIARDPPAPPPPGTSGTLYFDWETKRRAALERVMAQHTSTITGLVSLRRGGEGIIIVSPVFHGKKLRGNVLATLMPQPFFSSLLLDPNYEIEVFEQGRKVFGNVAQETSRKSIRWVNDSRVRIFGIDFVIRTIPKPATVRESADRLGDIILFTGAIISLLAFLTIRFARFAQERRLKVEWINQRLESILKLVPVAIFETDIQNSRVFVNETWSHYTGLKAEDAENDKWVNAIHVEDLPRVEQEWKRLTQEQTPFQLQFRYVNQKTGQIRWVKSHAVALFNLEKKVIGYIGAALDFTDQKFAEEKLRENERFLATALDNLPVALFCKDSRQGFNFTLWNRSAEQIWGLTASQVLGQNDFDLFPPSQASLFRARDLEVMASGKIHEIGKESVSTPHRGTLTVSTKKVPIADETGEPRFLLGISEDITEKLLTAKQLEEQRVMLIHAERMALLGEMAGGIAHEINNPLTIIDGYLHRLRSIVRESAPDQPPIAGAVEGISKTADRIAKIIKGLRSFARDGESDPLENVKLKEVLTESLEFCQTRFSNRGVRLHLDVDDSVILGRRVQISQVLVNLLNNAFDAVADLKDPWIRLGVKGDNNRVVIKVTDSGTGISPENLAKVMNPFFTTKVASHGMGLGLSISANIARAHGGTLRVNSKSPNTEFILEIPRIEN